MKWKTQTSLHRAILRWRITGMRSLFWISRVMTRISCLSCRLGSSSSRMATTRWRETWERIRRARLIICNQAQSEIARNCFNWWISSLLRMLDRVRRLQVNSESSTQLRSLCHMYNSNKAQLPTSKRFHNNSTPRWAPITCQIWPSNLASALVWTQIYTALLVEHHITISICWTTCNSRTCTYSSITHRTSSCKTLEALDPCNKPIIMVRDSNIFLNR